MFTGNNGAMLKNKYSKNGRQASARKRTRLNQANNPAFAEIAQVVVVSALMMIMGVLAVKESGLKSGLFRPSSVRHRRGGVK